MRITSSAVSLNVADERVSAAFLRDHFGFAEEMSADGFVSLTRPDAGFNVIFLRTGLPTFKPAARACHAGDGLLLVFVVALAVIAATCCTSATAMLADTKRSLKVTASDRRAPAYCLAMRPMLDALVKEMKIPGAVVLVRSAKLGNCFLTHLRFPRLDGKPPHRS